MGQAANVTNDTALDTVITNALIVDAVAGVIKADVGIKVCPSTCVTIYDKVPQCTLQRFALGWKEDRG